MRSFAKRCAWMIGVFLVACVGLAGIWPPFGDLARKLGREFGCWGSSARTECVQAKHQVAERKALQSIEDELRSLR